MESLTEAILTHPVTVTGRSFAGAASQITLAPAPQNLSGNKSAWYWKHGYNSDVTLVPISHTCASFRPRRIALVHGEHSLEIIEHITPLRFMGLSNVVIESGRSWPPYFGRTLEFCEALHGCIHRTRTLVRWCTVKFPITISHQTPLGGYTQWKPTKDGEHSLTVEVTVCNPKTWKRFTLERSFPRDWRDLPLLFEAYTTGRPDYLKPISHLLQFFHLWHHHNHINWMDRHKEKDFLRTWAEHRLCDLLGALALTHPTRLPAGTVTSVFGGHQSDLMLLGQAAKQLQPL